MPMFTSEKNYMMMAQHFSLLAFLLYLVTITQSHAQESGLHFPRPNLPSLNPAIYGRAPFLLNLKELLVKNGSNVVIIGPPQVGKTQLVLKLITEDSDNKDELDSNVRSLIKNVIWINGTSEKTIKESLSQLVIELNVPLKSEDDGHAEKSDIIKLNNAVFHHLSLISISNPSEKFLIILDDANVKLYNNLILTSISNASSNIQLLITSRETEWENNNNNDNNNGIINGKIPFQLLHLNPLTLDDLVDIIHNELNIESKPTAESEIDKKVIELSQILLKKINGQPQLISNTIKSFVNYIKDQSYKENADNNNIKQNELTVRFISDYIIKLKEELKKTAELNRIDDEISKLNELALQVIKENKDFEKAKELKELTYELSLQKLPLYNPGKEREKGERSAMSNLNQLADTLMMLRRFEEALELYEKVDVYRTKKLGDNHEDTLSTRQSMAVVLLNLNQPGRALPMLKMVHETRKISLGKEHRDTIYTLGLIASILFQSELREYEEEALELFTFIHEVQERNLGEEDLETMETLGKIAKLQVMLGQHEKAVESYSKLYPIRRYVLGLENMDTIESLDGLGGALTLMGDSRRALPIHKQVYELCKSVLGPEHPKTILALSGLAMGLAGEGLFDQALKLSAHVYEMHREKFGDDHPQTKISHKVYENIKEKKEAMEKYRKEL